MLRLWRWNTELKHWDWFAHKSKYICKWVNEHIELPAKLLDSFLRFLRCNKNKINQCRTYACVMLHLRRWKTEHEHWHQLRSAAAVAQIPVAVWCSVVQCGAVRCSVLSQKSGAVIVRIPVAVCIAVWHSVLLSVALGIRRSRRSSVTYVKVWTSYVIYIKVGLGISRTKTNS